MNNKYERELASLKPHDTVQYTTEAHGLPFIVTAGHGYLVVPRGHAYSRLAREICSYGFLGRHAIYLEEDCEAPEFIHKINL